MKSLGLNISGRAYIENISIPHNVKTEKVRTGWPSGPFTSSHVPFVESHRFSIGQKPTYDMKTATPTNAEIVKTENTNAINLK